ncbi:unnamed protein product, partial [Mesorhabditis belari]|uniref:glutathione-specific gamma-glutamylcyclotransferase n=1 Tax=Mesorhabditis belari TaxID=2138241 RepID=A0AAF3EVU0_9BILA
MWIFGYGSLMWYTDFPYQKVLGGTVRGFERRFWQLSPDHRGTPEKPGRTVTLVSVKEGHCWGLAYKVPENEVEKTIKYLDHREKAGYSIQYLDFYPDNGEKPFKVAVYISPQSDNEFHAGPTEIEEVALQILDCHGPSGPNLEYALRVADILHKKAPHYIDEHVFELEKLLLKKAIESGTGLHILETLGYSAKSS